MDILNMNVGGAYLWTWLLGFVVFLGLFFFGNSWWETKQAIDKSKGRILVLFHTMAGTAYWKWCPFIEGELLPPDLKGYDKDARELSRAAIGKLEAAKQAFGWYFILPDHVFQIPYPFTKPKITITIAEYVENYPAPRVTANIQKWDAEQYGLVTSQLAMASKDTTDIKAIISQAAGIEEVIGQLTELPNDVRMVKYMSMGNLGVGVIVGILVFQVMGTVGKLAAQYGITWLESIIRVITG